MKWNPWVVAWDLIAMSQRGSATTYRGADDYNEARHGRLGREGGLEGLFGAKHLKIPISRTLL